MSSTGLKIERVIARVVQLIEAPTSSKLNSICALIYSILFGLDNSMPVTNSP